MKSKMHILAMAIVGISLRTAASAMASTTLGPADGYSAFVFGNMTAATDTWGSVAVGGDANFSGGYSINSATAGNNYALIVGGNYTQNSSTINGNVIVGNSATYSTPTVNGSLAAQSVSLQGGGSVSGGVFYSASYSGPSYISHAKAASNPTLPIDFSGAESTLGADATSWAALTANGTALSQYSTLTLTGSSSTLDIFDITTTELAGISTIRLSVPTGTTPTVLVNVDGSAANISGGISGFTAASTLWNFYNADSVTISGVALTGTLMATSGRVNFQSGQVDGAIIAANLNQNSGAEIDAGSFTGSLPSSAPTTIPASALRVPPTLALVGIGAIALAALVVQRRRVELQ